MLNRLPYLSHNYCQMLSICHKITVVQYAGSVFRPNYILKPYLSHLGDDLWNIAEKSVLKKKKIRQS